MQSHFKKVAVFHNQRKDMSVQCCSDVSEFLRAKGLSVEPVPCMVDDLRAASLFNAGYTEKLTLAMPQGAAILPAGAGGDNAAPALNVRQESAPAASQDLNLQRFASGGTTGEADYFATIVNEGGGESSPELNRTGAAARETVAVAQAIRSSSPTLTAFGAKKSGSKMKPVLIVLVLLAVGGAALMFLGGGGKKKIPAAEKTAPAETAAPAASAPAQTPAPSASSMKQVVA